MLSPADNELLCRTNAGTPMGELMRRFWHPVLLASELPAVDGPPKRIRVLGEDLVAFRDTSGRVGIVQQACPHRRAGLFWGRNEEHGLRCVYHGWKFDVEGRCVDMPSEPESSNFKDKIRIKAYPTEEYGSCIWIYMGPPAVKPALPRFEWAEVPEEQRVMSRWIQRSNFMQATEGEIDSTHLSYLHSRLNPDRATTPGRSNTFAIADDGTPLISVRETPFGLSYGARREEGQGDFYWRVTHWLLPTYSLIPSPIGLPRHGRAWIPIDDEHISSIQYAYHVDRPLTEEEIYHRTSFSPEVEPVEYRMPDGKVIDTFWDVRRAENDYLIDREMQKTKNFSGIPMVRTQDTAVTESMGAITQRPLEHLGTSDLAVIVARRRLLRMARDLMDGIEPTESLDSDIYHIRAIDLHCDEPDFDRLLDVYAEEGKAIF